jgi:hypothetical protein
MRKLAPVAVLALLFALTACDLLRPAEPPFPRICPSWTYKCVGFW